MLVLKIDEQLFAVALGVVRIPIQRAKWMIIKEAQNRH